MYTAKQIPISEGTGGHERVPYPPPPLLWPLASSLSVACVCVREMTSVAFTEQKCSPEIIIEKVRKRIFKNPSAVLGPYTFPL